MRTPLDPDDASGLRRIFDHLGPAMFVGLAEPDGTLLIVNRSATEIGDVREEDVIGRRLYELAAFNHSQAVAARARHAVDRAGRGEPQRFDIEVMVRHGRLITVDFSLQPVRDDQGEVIYLVPSCHDVTERVEAHAELRRRVGHDLRAQRLASIGTLAGGIAHDLNNVLAPIVMSIDLLRQTATSDEDRALLETIATSARRGAEMVRHVLSFARGLQAERTRLQPRDLITEVEKIVRDTFPKNIDIRAECVVEPWPILGDSTQLHQVLINLCVNARDAMPDGGSLLLRASNVEVDGCALVRFEVEDSGQGMEPAVVDQIFDPFFTTKEVGRGTGLGLPTSLAIVKGHQGSLHVSSLSGTGSRFTVFIPAVFGMPTAAATSETSNFPRGGGETILVVDDEASIRRVTRQTLETHGYRVLTAADGREGLASYRANKGRIAAVITDLKMPVMDGASMIDELLALEPELPVIASSGFSTPPPDAVRGRVRAMLAKPYSAETLLVTLREVLPG
ncbi:MAG: ATP-binding protein [Acidobacteriota bacterium]|nr:ATP-binding protein [Acidobacteriota bacterium]